MIDYHGVEWVVIIAFCGASIITLGARALISRCSRQTVATLIGGKALAFTKSEERVEAYSELSYLRPGEDGDGGSIDSERALEVLLFQAGIVTATGVKLYRAARWLTPLVLASLALAVMYHFELGNLWLVTILVFAVGFQLPRSFLRSRINQRNQEILFYLPLVVEQIVLGVSSSLDIGPCLKWIVDMADERDSHNAVTQLLALVQQLMKSGVAVDESLKEVARLSGNTELKHVFMALSQVVRHGGEVSRQLHELASAVATQREVSIEGRIKGLEIRATAPVALIFASFMGIFLTGLGLQLFSSFR